MIRNENAYQDDGLDYQSYMLLYSDESCTEFEGTHGLVAGVTPLKATSESMNCSEAVACAFLPEGLKCRSYGGTTGEIINVRTKLAASKVVMCYNDTDENDYNNDKSCEEIDPNMCVRSEVYPSCWVRMVTAKVFFSHPEEFLTSTKFPLVREEDPDTTRTPTLGSKDRDPASSTFSPRMVGLVLMLIVPLIF